MEESELFSDVVVVGAGNAALTAALAACEAGAQVLVLAPSVGGVKEASNYLALFDYDVNLLVGAFKQIGTK